MLADGLSISLAARECSHAIALIFEDKAYSFAELAQLVSEIQYDPVLVSNTNLEVLLTIHAAFESKNSICLVPTESDVPKISVLAEADTTTRGPSVILLTSGSSGLPKAVALPHTAFRAAAIASAKNLGWKKEDYTPLKEGLKKTCEWFIMSYPDVRGVN